MACVKALTAKNTENTERRLRKWIFEFFVLFAVDWKWL